MVILPKFPYPRDYHYIQYLLHNNLTWIFYIQPLPTRVGHVSTRLIFMVGQQWTNLLVSNNTYSLVIK